jgi:hypothetical protein
MFPVSGGSGRHTLKYCVIYVGCSMTLLESNDRIFVNSEIKKIEGKCMGYYPGA